MENYKLLLNKYINKLFNISSQSTSAKYFLGEVKNCLFF